MIARSEHLLSAGLISWFDAHQAPLVVFSMTRLEAQRQGMARRLLQASINALLDAQYARLTLLVTESNSPARQLYSGLGFTPWL